MDALDRPSIDRREGRAKNLVAANDLPQAALEGRNVQVAAQAQRRLEVIRTVRRVQLLQEPDPLLRRR